MRLSRSSSLAMDRDSLALGPSPADSAAETTLSCGLHASSAAGLAAALGSAPSEPAKAAPATWAMEEDLLIMQLVQRHGKQWTKIAKHFPGRSDNSVRNRYNRMQRGDEVRRELGSEHGYRCKLCGLPKRGHICAARTMGTPLESAAVGEALMEAQAVPVEWIGRAKQPPSWAPARGLQGDSTGQMPALSRVAAADCNSGDAGNSGAVEAQAHVKAQADEAADADAEAELNRKLERVSSRTRYREAPEVLLQELQLTLAISDLEEMVSERVSGASPQHRTSDGVTPKPPMLPSDSILNFAMSYICVGETAESPE